MYGAQRARRRRRRHKRPRAYVFALSSLSPSRLFSRVLLNYSLVRSPVDEYRDDVSAFSRPLNLGGAHKL